MTYSKDSALPDSPAFGVATSVEPGGPAGQVRVQLLGGFQVTYHGRTVGPRQLGGTKPRLILEALVLNGGAPVSKEKLIASLSDGRSSTYSKGNLETSVCILRRQLHDGLGLADDLVTTTVGSYAIDMTRIDVDVRRVQAGITASLHPGLDTAAALTRLESLLPLWGLELMPDEIAMEWVEQERGDHATQVVADLSAAALLALPIAPGLADRWACAALRRDGLCEPAWLAHIGSFQARGLFAEGLRAYERCRRAFDHELGCTPGPQLRVAYAELLRATNAGDDDLSRLFDALLALHGTTHDSPVPGHLPPHLPVQQALATLASFLKDLEVRVDTAGALTPSVSWL